MTSKLKTDVLETVSGSGTIALTNQLSGMTDASMPSGSVIQVVSHKNSSQNGTTSTSFVATDSTVTITPTSTSSKIYILTSSPMYSNANDGHIYTTIYRGSTNVNGSAELQLFAAGNNSMGRWSNGSMSFLDSPATTSATTYTVYFRRASGSTVYYDANGGMATITLMEIKG